METLRRLLAFPMYATAAWLAWVFSQQVGDQQTGNLGLAGILAAAVLIAAAAWCYGHRQAASLAGRRSWGFATLGVVALIAGLAALWGAADQPAPTPRGAPTTVSKAELPSQLFSPDRLAALRAAGKPVFVDFTAAWCITCQVNDRVALSSRRISDAFAAKGVTFLVGDWTNRNADIAQALAEHGRAGVPLYLVYPAGGGEPAVLPQILTEDIVLAALNKAVP
jgi:thiol:disulfide interchange protein DsbD